MIRNSGHKGLQRLFEDGARKGVRADLVEKVENVLLVLNRAERPGDMNLPGFRFEDGASDVDPVDYH